MENHIQQFLLQNCFIFYFTTQYRSKICYLNKAIFLFLSFIFALFYYAGVYPRTFVYSRFSPKIQFLQCLLSSVARWRCPMVDIEGKMFEIQVCGLLKNAFFLDFSGNLEFIHTYIQVSFMRVFNYLNQRVRRIGEQNGKSLKRFSFITQFKIEFLLPFNGVEKCLEKCLIMKL